MSLNNYHYKWSINVWGRIIQIFVIDQYFFEGCVTGPVFLKFLCNDFLRLNSFVLIFYHLPEYNKNRMWIQLDYAPHHFCIKERFAESWTRRTVKLTLFHILSCLRNYRPNQMAVKITWFYNQGFFSRNNLNNILELIRQSFINITPDVLNKVRQCFRNRLG